MSVQVTRLDSGIRVVTDAMPHLETASVGAWFDVGARYESEAQNGISHLLEHMAFKGTESRTARQIAEEVEAVGGHLNAYTSRDHTTYYARVMKGDVPLAVDVLSDILQNTLLDPTELAREKDVILQEIGQAHDTPDDLVFDRLQATAFPDQPMGRPILGSAAHVSGFSADDIRAYLDAYYTAGRMVFAGAGNLDHDALVALVDDRFAHLPPSTEGAFEPARYVGGQALDDRALEQLHLVFGLPGIAYDDDEFYALQVYNAILGGGMSSRLFQEVREERGLAYSVYSFSASHADGGLFGIYAGTGPEHARELTSVVAGQMQDLTVNVEADELGRAKAQLKAGLLMSLESTSSRIEQLGRQMLIFDRPLPTEELVHKVEAIDADAVRHVAARILDGALSAAAVGPIDGFSKGDSFAELFSAGI